MNLTFPRYTYNYIIFIYLYIYFSLQLFFSLSLSHMSPFFSIFPILKPSRRAEPRKCVSHPFRFSNTVTPARFLLARRSPVSSFTWRITHSGLAGWLAGSLTGTPRWSSVEQFPSWGLEIARDSIVRIYRGRGFHDGYSNLRVFSVRWFTM